MRVRLVEPGLFMRKTASVFVLAFALVPLMSMKQDLPALAYAFGLLVLHLFVLGVYLYRVRFRELDPGWRPLVARIAALAFVIYLLAAISDFQPGAPLSTLALQMLAVSALHTLVLVLLMTRIELPGALESAVIEARAAAEAASGIELPSAVEAP